MAISFVAAILIGTAFLLLPFSTKSGHISFIDALFRATSSVCVTGLVVQDTATHFTTFGLIVNMALFQLGGVGIMTFSTMILLVAGRRISFKDRILIQEGFHHASPKDFKSLIKGIFYYTLCIELFGALFLFLYWQKKLSLTKGIFYSVFHSISAFCNAGFALFSDNFESFRDSIWMNAVILFLVILSSMYPAFKAIRLNAAQAMRTYD